MNDNRKLMPPGEEYCSLTEAARLLNLTEGFIHGLTMGGELRPAGPGPRRYRRADVEALRRRRELSRRIGLKHGR